MRASMFYTDIVNNIRGQLCYSAENLSVDRSPRDVSEPSAAYHSAGTSCVSDRFILYQAVQALAWPMPIPNTFNHFWIIVSQ